MKKNLHCNSNIFISYFKLLAKVKPIILKMHFKVAINANITTCFASPMFA